MPRKKKENVLESNEEYFVYCGLLKCPHIHCLRHHKNAPWNVIIHQRKFNPDKDWHCKDIVED